MFKKFKSIVALFMAVVLILGQNSYAFARAEVNALAPYQEKPIFLNNELDTDYVLSPTEDTTYDEMVTFYTNMSINEFEKYVRDAYAAYKAERWTSSFSDDKKTVDMSYRCVKCVSQNLIYATKYTVNMTFKAGAGDIHAIITV